jgi:Fe-S-cluster containining protein
VKCGICCGDTPAKTRHILLLKTEAEQISNATNQPTSEFAMKIEGKEPYSYEMVKTTKEGACVFLKEKQCTIYASRPLVCRFYPFELKTTSPRKHRFTPTDECPGLGKGRTLQREYFRKMFRLAHCQVKKCNKD